MEAAFSKASGLMKAKVVCTVFTSTPKIPVASILAAEGELEMCTVVGVRSSVRASTANGRSSNAAVSGPEVRAAIFAWGSLESAAMTAACSAVKIISLLARQRNPSFIATAKSSSLLGAIATAASRSKVRGKNSLSSEYAVRSSAEAWMVGRTSSAPEPNLEISFPTVAWRAAQAPSFSRASAMTGPEDMYWHSAEKWGSPSTDS
mmetsp:Transcript_17294/g.52282  ORF Transcript_17294/g.52282 Transcript_17294/m.52282 type:complete len:205 (-) Transcript_17294:182-796(-)